MMPDQMNGMLQKLKANPMQFLLQRRLNVPQSLDMSNPQEILNYLLRTGQVNQQQINSAYQMMGQFKR